MKGHIRRRGERSWELKFDIGVDAVTGKRGTRYHSFKGSKREAEAELARLVAGVSHGAYVDPSKLTLREFLERWRADWAILNLSPKTYERYSELINSYVREEIGGLRLQRVKPANLNALYAHLLQNGRVGKGTNRGLSPRTVAYFHRVLHRAFGHALRWGLIASNPTESVDPPRATHREIAILTEQQVRDVLGNVRGRPFYYFVALGLATGMRRGELLALRWKDVTLDGAKIQVNQSLEQTKGGLRFKTPKTRHGRRSISIPASIVTELRALRRLQNEQRLALGLGRDGDESLVFRRVDGAPLLPNSVSTEWRRLVKSLGLPQVTLHAWRHTHASQLIASGMDVLTISRRLGHGSPSITLDVYGHLFSASDDKAAAVFETAFGRVLTE